VPRAVPIVEAMAALVLADMFLLAGIEFWYLTNKVIYS
jgi:chorismate synthase